MKRHKSFNVPGGLADNGSESHGAEIVQQNGLGDIVTTAFFDTGQLPIAAPLVNDGRAIAGDGSYLAGSKQIQFLLQLLL